MSTVTGPAPLTSRRSIAALLVACLLALGAVAALAVRGVAGAGGGGGAPTGGSGGLAGAPGAFLGGYERADGRVARSDPGGDTVSEGQAYAMLVAEATGDRSRFDAAWRWAEAHLEQPDGLMAWRWVDGRVVDPQSATDADLTAAAALLGAGQRFADPADTAAGRRVAGAVLTADVVDTPAGPVLAAGPWATVTPVRVDPSYLATPELVTIADALGGQWQAVLRAARTQLQSLTAGGTLPSDWAVVGGDGAVHPAAPPADPSAPVRFGFDAVRVPIWLAASCDPADRRTAASLLPALRRGGGKVGLDLGGRPAPGSDSPVGDVALADAEAASGTPPTAAVDAALAGQRAHPTYYSAALLALDDLAGAHRLGSC